MKKSIFISSALLVSFLFFQLSFSPNNLPPEDRVKETFLQNLEDVLEEVSAFSTLLETAQNGDDRLESQFKKARISFKKAEFLAEYYDHTFVKRRLNGANLPSLNENVPEISTTEPHGFQVLEEAVFGDDFPNNRTVCLSEAQFLKKALAQYIKTRRSIPIYDNEVFEALRQQVIRIFTLGVTGFDSPVLQHSLPEAKASLYSIQDALAAFVGSNHATIFLVKAAMAYVDKNDDFNSFDRLVFLTDYINPIYGQLLDVQKELNISLPSDIYAAPAAVNYEAKNLFDQQFLDPGFYAKFHAEEDAKKRELGRLLFFDPILSGNNKRACASCHNPEMAFTDGETKSLAFNFQGRIKRNSPTLLNASFSERFFYDFKVHSIEDQTEIVLIAPDEFNTNYKMALEKVEKSEEYVKLFKEAFGDSEKPVNRNTIAYALAEYVRSLSALDSPFDQYVRGETKKLDKDVKAGFNLFMGKAACGTCHFAPVFNGTIPPLYKESESEVLGVTATEDFENPVLDGDLGRFETIRQSAPFFLSSFKTVTVRNAEETAPYMHNGAYKSLEKVVEFYNEGGGAGLGLDLPHQTLPADKLDLTDKEQEQLVAFIKSLTHNPFKGDKPQSLPAFGDPKLDKRVAGGEY